MRKTSIIGLLILMPLAGRADFFPTAVGDTGHTVVSLGAAGGNAGAALPWDGEQHATATFAARSIKDLSSRDRLWGGASYDYGLRRQTAWSETSDAALLYPYLTADSIGGDLRSETYRFEGGYRRMMGDYYAGGMFAYRALQEYRNADPRPLNTVADIRLSVLGGRRIGDHAFLEVDLGYRRYKQTNSMSFYSELGHARIYNLTGLGTWSYRFSGNSNTSYYKGNGLQASLGLHEAGAAHLSAELGYRLFSVQKIMTDVNNLPLSRLRLHELSASTAGSGGRWSWAVDGQLHFRQGSEYVYGDAAGNAYALIGITTPYHAASGKVEASVTRSLGAATVWQITPRLGFLRSRFSLDTPARHLAASHLPVGLDCKVATAPSAPLAPRLTLDFGGLYAPRLSQFSPLTFEPSPLTAHYTAHMSDHLQSNRVEAHAQATLRFPTRRSFVWFITLGGDFIHYNLINANSWQTAARFGISL